MRFRGAGYPSTFLVHSSGMILTEGTMDPRTRAFSWGEERVARFITFATSVTPPVVSYRRKTGVSVTGGYVYRGTRSPSFVGAYIFSDFESKTIWAMKQQNRKLTMIRKIGQVPEKPASFGIAADGELFIVGYQGTIFRLVLDQSVLK